MDEKRREWCEKYKIKIADGGFTDKFCLPKHVEYILPLPGGKPYFIGFDGKSKTYEELTEEEKEDWQLQVKDMPRKLNEFVNRKHNQERENIGREPGE